jgi:hypothetical protein
MAPPALESGYRVAVEVEALANPEAHVQGVRLNYTIFAREERPAML